MKNRRQFLMTAVLFCGMAGYSHSVTLDDSKDLQGNWEILSLEANGEKKPAAEQDLISLSVEGDQMWAVKASGPDPKVRYRLDPSKSPKGVNLTVQEGQDQGKVVLGIYDLQGDQFRICINLFGEAARRPSDFKTQERDGFAVVTLKRMKAK